MTEESKNSVYFLSALKEFYWNGDHITLIPGIEIVRSNLSIENISYSKFISKRDIQQIQESTHILRMEISEFEYDYYIELLHLFLLALWIKKYSGTIICFRFLDPPYNPHQGESPLPVQRIGDHYHYIHDQKEFDISTEDLENVGRNLASLEKIHKTSSRLATAIYFTHYANTTIRWQGAFTNCMVAIEALFSPEKRGGVTKQICSRVSCFLESDHSKRESLYFEMDNLYDIRSGIIHGRYKLNIGDKIAADRNLEDLFKLVSILRRCWGKILGTPKLINVFTNETKRTSHLDSLTSGFNHPKITRGI
ncbi:MAG: hypothetical protein IIB40_11900 [Candidatus Marinimicrobia bacterium]|nr:hypothetical protein [Candidatus Neomarinimicrobiota bacterium]